MILFQNLRTFSTILIPIYRARQSSEQTIYFFDRNTIEILMSMLSTYSRSKIANSLMLGEKHIAI